MNTVHPRFVQAFLRGLAHISNKSEGAEVLIEIENNPDHYIESQEQFARYQALKREVEANV